jgi:2-oxoglutarate dehydrogenase E2 component (dihydrolipoamide succinyltransferase)
MTTQVVVPQLGESVVEATVGEWLKQEGDTVSVGEVIVSLETDKVDVEVGAETSGVLTKIERQVGEDVAIGDVLAVIEEDGAGPQPDGAPQEAPAEAQPQVTGGTEAVGAEPMGAAAMEAQPRAETGDTGGVTPVARRMAEEQGVDLGQVSGSGAGGRVTKQDVESFLKQQQAPAPEARQPQQQPAAQPQRAPAAQPQAAPSSQPEREERQRMTRRRRTIAQRLVEAQQTAAMLTTFNEIDMTAVVEMRKRWRDSFQEQHGIKLGFMSFFVKASVGALKAFPRLNAEIDGDEIVLKRYYDIGMAIGAEEGLVVPVIRDADRLSFAEIEQAIKDYVGKVQDGSLTLEDLRGGTFTITNGGVFGSLLSTPILNPPQVGILGLHKIEERPIAVDGEVVVRPMMYVALSYDHRIVDGREAVQFLVKLKELIEDPERLLLEG